MTFKVDKSKLVDSSGKPLTQSLFLELKYEKEFAIYTLKDEDYEYDGKLYPSLKKLFLELEDVTEYDFANKYLLGWKHWRRLNDNKLLTNHFADWREELELKIKAQAVRDIINLSASESGGFQAAKWLADRGWEKRGAGRPSKEELAKNTRINERLDEEFSADIARLQDYRK